MATKDIENNEPRPEFDFSRAKPNPYARQFADGAHYMAIDSELAEFFGGEEAVNEALRSLMIATRASSAGPVDDRERVDNLWQRFEEAVGVTIRNDLIEHYLPLVRIAAERIREKLNFQVEVDELIQAGVFGLMDAVDGFDPKRGGMFEDYALHRIQGAIADDLRSQDIAPHLFGTRSHRMDRASNQIKTEFGRVRKDAEVAEKLGISVAEYDRWCGKINRSHVASLDSAVDDEG